MEYKFRGKRTVLGQSDWIYGYGAIDNDILTLDFAKGIVRVECDKGTVGQYTGLKDKNGVEIYEGDVVQCWGGEYCQGYWEHSTRDIVTSDPYLLVALSEYEHVEIIGNIHDNPELLQEVTP